MADRQTNSAADSPQGHIRASVKVGHSGYQSGCRCDGCRNGYRDYMRRYTRKRKTESPPKPPVSRKSKRWSGEAFGVDVPELSLDYIAGLFDGEGCVGLYVGECNKHDRALLKVSISNTNVIPLLAIQRQFSGALYQRKAAAGVKMPVFVLNWRHQEGYDFLKAIAGRLVIKKEQTALAMEFWELSRLPREERLEPFDDPAARRRWRRKPEVVEREQNYVDRLKALKVVDMSDVYARYLAACAAETCER